MEKRTFFFSLASCGCTEINGCMPRTVRASVGGICYHVIVRGNAQLEVFHKDGDYRAFVELIGLACQRIPMRVLAYCVMPNHFHLALWPPSDRDLGRWMQWLLTAHVRRYHQHYRSSGHVWQGRFKAFPIEQNEHLLTVLRYVDPNPLRAGLLGRHTNTPGRHYENDSCEAAEWFTLACLTRRCLNQAVSDLPNSTNSPASP